ncbi:MAG: hypothetical protein KGY70_15390, partial [Bacteroidales bacterium]|nr:hypothetical protein [Bacteroidales bacterium]
KEINDINGGSLRTGNQNKGSKRLKHIRIYNRNLMHTEVIGNQNAFEGYHKPLLLNEKMSECLPAETKWRRACPHAVAEALA